MNKPAKRPRIVVAWDGSAGSSITFPLARVIGSQLGADIEILHVLEPSDVAEDVWAMLHELTAEHAADYHLRVEPGDVVQAITAEADDPGVALVILTTHVDAIKQGRELGSIAEAVIISTVNPILLVRPEAPLARRELKRLLLPLDGTPTTATALRPAIELADRLGASLDLLYVASSDGISPAERGSVGVPRYVDQPQHEWPEWAGEVVERMALGCAACPPDMPVRLSLASGDVGAEIPRFARDREADAVVLVRRSELQKGRGLVLRAVLAGAPCPVLVVGGPDTHPGAGLST